jgi:hypothetical protein
MNQIEMALRTVERALIMRANAIADALAADPVAQRDARISGGVVGYAAAAKELGMLIDDFTTDPTYISLIEQVASKSATKVQEPQRIGFYL